MSQRAVFVRVNGNLHDEVFTSVPDYDDAVQICKDFGYTSEDAKYDGDYIFIEYDWLEIGDGESGTDTFYDGDALLAMYDGGFFNFYDIEIETIEQGCYEVLFEDLE